MWTVTVASQLNRPPELAHHNFRLERDAHEPGGPVKGQLTAAVGVLIVGPQNLVLLRLKLGSARTLARLFRFSHH